MVMVGDEKFVLGALNHRNQVVGEKVLQVMRAVAQLLEMLGLLMDLDHPDRDLRRPQVVDGDVVDYCHAATLLAGRRRRARSYRDAANGAISPRSILARHGDRQSLVANGAGLGGA